MLFDFSVHLLTKKEIYSMAISLQKGGNVNLSKEAPGMKKMLVGLGWDVRATDGEAFDLDSSAFLLTMRRERCAVMRTSFSTIRPSRPTARSSIPATTGQAPAKAMTKPSWLTFPSVPAEIEKISVCVTIHEAEARRQNFGMVARRLYPLRQCRNNVEVAKYDLSEDASVETAMIFGEIYRHGGDWKFKAIGQGFQGGLGPLAKNFGVSV
jgi:tellurium resistance protein TerD